jgi:hypothetical protein
MVGWVAMCGFGRPVENPKRKVLSLFLEHQTSLEAAETNRDIADNTKSQSTTQHAQSTTQHAQSSTQHAQSTTQHATVCAGAAKSLPIIAAVCANWRQKDTYVNPAHGVLAVEEGVFTSDLLPAAPAGIFEQVDVWRLRCAHAMATATLPANV